jgi:hypothetical protein
VLIQVSRGGIPRTRFVSSSVYNWLRGSTPPTATCDKLPITIKISGRGMQLETMVSIETARKVVECINLLNEAVSRNW